MRRLALIALLAVAAYAALPYWSAYSLAQAFRTGDREVLERRVDWERLRASLKDDLSAAMVAGLQGAGPRNDVAAALGVAFGPALIDNMLQSVVNPASVAELARRAAAPGEGEGGVPDEMAEDPLGAVRWAFFIGPSEFLVTVSDEKLDGEDVDLYFERSGLSWRLVRVKLPDTALSGLQG